jgi:hypothetical protein
MTHRAIPPAALAVAVLALAGCGGGDESPAAPTVTVSIPQSTATTAPAQGSTTAAPTPSTEPDGTGPAETATEDPRTNALERSAARTVRRYVDALDHRDGAAVCDLLAPGALDAVKMPVARGSCAASLDASIGYRDPRGFPVWDRTKILKLRKVEVDGPSAKVVVSIVTDFSDQGRDPSYEDDIVYLTRAGGNTGRSGTPRWLVAKASSTLYRAVGTADVPLAVLSPPD